MPLKDIKGKIIIGTLLFLAVLAIGYVYSSLYRDVPNDETPLISEKETEQINVTEADVTWKKYQNDTYRYELQYPPGFTLSEKEGETWSTLSLTGPDYTLNFFAGTKGVGGVGMDHELITNKVLTVGGREVVGSLMEPSTGSEQILLVVNLARSPGRYDNFYSSIKRADIETAVPEIEAIITSFKDLREELVPPPQKEIILTRSGIVSMILPLGWNYTRMSPSGEEYDFENWRVFIYDENGNLAMTTNAPIREIGYEPLSVIEKFNFNTEIGDLSAEIRSNDTGGFAHYAWSGGEEYLFHLHSFEIFVPFRTALYPKTAEEQQNNKGDKVRFVSFDDFQQGRVYIETILKTISY